MNEDTSPEVQFGEHRLGERTSGCAFSKPVKCPECKGGSFLRRKYKNSASKVYCTTCDGIGWHGINPRKACPDLPGSQLKLGFLAARYRAGVVLWNRHDRAK